MPKDYDRSLTPQQVFANIQAHLRDGSLIVLHDSIKAGNRFRYAVEKTIDTYALNYTFSRLP